MPGHIIVLGHCKNLYKNREKYIIVENMGRFSLAVSHFLHRGNRIIDFSGEMPEGRLRDACFVLAPSRSRVVGAPVRLFRELMCMTDRWARPPLSARVASVAGGG
jgi:hypothetical protein